MSFSRTFHYSACGSLGMLLIVGTTLAQIEGNKADGNGADINQTEGTKVQGRQAEPDDRAGADESKALSRGLDPLSIIPDTGAVPAATVVAVPGPPDVAAIKSADECRVAQICIDRYLWSLYEHTRKIDTVGVPEQIKVAVRRKGKTKIITKTVTKFEVEDFGWKDPKAAEKFGMSPMDYVIGGMDPAFRVTLYHALRALEDAGLMPGITSAFRDDYRQTIASGKKAQSDRSFHGGSFRGGYGHGLAADIVSVKGETRAEQMASSDVMWKWIDAHERELGIGRPYRDRDAPHVGPLDGREYFAKRIEPNMQKAEPHAESKPKKQGHVAARHDAHEPSRHADRGASKGAGAARTGKGTRQARST